MSDAANREQLQALLPIARSSVAMEKDPACILFKGILFFMSMEKFSFCE